jgi:hypothetical protein
MYQSQVHPLVMRAGAAGESRQVVQLELEIAAVEMAE